MECYSKIYKLTPGNEFIKGQLCNKDSDQIINLTILILNLRLYYCSSRSGFII